jgi:ABC-type dipeptide/oligopeptide/nickel transport system ATPase component
MKTKFNLKQDWIPVTHNGVEGFVLVDKEAEIKEDDLHFDEYDNFIKKWEGNLKSHRIYSFKIIAQSPNLSLEGIPYLDLQVAEDVELKEAIENLKNITSWDSFRGHPILIYANKALDCLYKATQKKYTEEVYNTAIQVVGDNKVQSIREFLIRSLNQPADEIELDTEISHSGNGTYSARLTDIVDAELEPIKVYKTYEKDSKTYLKYI